MSASKVVSNRRKPPRAGMGRPKGSLNKSTRSVKEALMLAFEGRGGVQALQAWSVKEPTEFYKIWAKLVPHEVVGRDGGPIAVSQVWHFGGKTVTF